MTRRAIMVFVGFAAVAGLALTIAFVRVNDDPSMPEIAAIHSQEPSGAPRLPCATKEDLFGNRRVLKEVCRRILRGQNVRHGDAVSTLKFMRRDVKQELERKLFQNRRN